MPPERQRYPGKLLGNTPVAGDWRLLRLEQADLAGELRPGQRLTVVSGTVRIEAYVNHLASDWLALLVPPADTAAHLPAFGEVIIEGPLGIGWRDTHTAAPAVVLAAGAGIAAALALVDRLDSLPQLVLLDSAGLPFPFRPQPSTFIIGGLPPPVIAAAPFLEDRGIPSRLADPHGRPGCFEGSIVDLFRLWLASHPSSGLDVFTCLPAASLTELRQYPMLRLREAE